MSPQQIEDQALGLSLEQRAQLAQKLLLSLDATSDATSDAEIVQAWLEEARHRAQELDSGAVQPVSVSVKQTSREK